MPVLLRYIFFQVPGAVVVAAAATILHLSFSLPSGIAIAIVIGWLIKDAVLYRFVREAYVSGVATGVERLIGQPGVAIGDIESAGYVRVAGERWRAATREGAGRIAAGEDVRVVGCEGLRLVVERARQSDAGS